MSLAGAVIVTWNSADAIGACLDAAIARGLAVIVVDNGSTDSTVEEIRKRPQARLIANPANRGFAAAANQGIRELESPFVLLLNPDAVLRTGVEPLLGAVAEPGVGAAGGKLLDGQDRAQTGFMVRRFPTGLSLSFEILGVNRLWPGNPVNRYYRCLDLDPDAKAEVDQPAGAFLMIRREAWQAIGGLDERFHPLWFEDVDFLKRLREAGFRAVYEPAAVASHRGGHSAAKIPRECRQVYWYASLLGYVFKHFRPAARRTVCAVLLLGAALRMVSEVVFVRSLNPIKSYLAVMRLAGRGLISGGTGEAGGAPALAQR
jgi:GT2 family glycosyltransferase